MNGNKKKERTGKVVAYLRVSTVKQDTENQMLVINEYARQNGLKVDEVVRVELSSRRSRKERLIDQLLEDLRPGDTLITMELSRLGRSLGEVVNTVETLTKKKVKLICIKQNLVANGKNDPSTTVLLAVFSALAQVERELISERTKAGLQRARAEGKKLGNPNLNLNNESYRRGAQEFAESLRPVLSGLQAQGYSQRRIVEQLNKNGVKARHGGQWSLVQLQNVLKRLQVQPTTA
jgi:DNA invertase Pin-like site-specific DNA recombinase